MSGISGMGAPGYAGYPQMNNNSDEVGGAKSQQPNVPQELPVASDPMIEMQAATVEVAQMTEEDRSKIDKKEENDIEELSEASSTEEVSESQEVDDVETPTPEDLEMINDMKKTIKKQSFKVARKVNRSAFNYMAKKKGWIPEDMDKEAEEFFTIRIPKVMAKELSAILNQALGLDLEEDDINVA